VQSFIPHSLRHFYLVRSTTKALSVCAQTRYINLPLWRRRPLTSLCIDSGLIAVSTRISLLAQGMTALISRPILQLD